MKICVQTGNVIDDLGFEEGYRLLREVGFEGIDWNINHALPAADIRAGKLSGCIFERPLPEMLDYYQQELEAIRKNGLAISQAHAPFPAHVRGIPQADAYLIEIYQSCIRLCDAAGCKNLVIHGVSASPAEPELSAEDVGRINWRLYSSLIPTLQQAQVTVCLENLFTSLGGCRYEGACSNAGEAASLIDALNEQAGRECFGLCLDTGHLHLLRKNVREYVRLMGHRIKALHIHDNDSVSDQHLMPFAGSLRWNDFTGALREAGYQGDLCFETFQQVSLSRMDKEYIPIFLRAIHDVGALFRERIAG